MSGRVVNYHISSKMAEGFDTIRKTTCRSLSQDCLPAPPVRQTSTSTTSLPQDSEASTCRPAVTRSQSISSTTWRDPLRCRETQKKRRSGHRSCTVTPVAIQRTHQKIKMRTPIKYGETRCAIFLNGWKISQRILWTDGFRHLRDAPASSSCESETAAPKEVVLGKHSVYTHFRKDRSFEIRKRTNNTRARCRKRTGKAIRRAENVGHLITADHKVLSEGCESRHNHRYAVVVQDVATQRIQAYPSKMKNSQETEKSLRNFLEPLEKPKVIYTDNSLEFGKANYPGSLYVYTSSF